MAPISDRRRRRRRDRSAQLAVLGVAVVAGLIAAITANPHRAAASKAPAHPVVNPPHPVGVVLPAGTLLVGHVDRAQQLDLLVLFGWDRGARTGTALLIPPTLIVDVPSLGPQSLAEVPRLVSAAALPVVVANALDVRVNGTVLFDDTAIAKLFAAAGRLHVNFPVATRVDDAGGTVAFNAGPQRVESSDAVRLLVGQQQDALAHLVTVGAVLDGWRAALATSAPGRATIATDRRVLPLVIGASAAMHDVTVPVEQLSSGAATRYQLRQPDATVAVRQGFPASLIARGTRPRVQVLNGAGGVGLTQQVAARIVPAGGQVTLTGNVAGFGVPKTLVVYYQPSELPVAQRLARALGIGKVARSAETVDVVDITIVVGKDFTPSR